MEFSSDPLGWLDNFARSGQGVGWIAPRQLCVADPLIGRDVLRNVDGLYCEHSDFFSTRAGLFGPRAAQIGMGRQGRSFIEQYMRRMNFEEAIAGLGSTSHWPRAGTRLMLDMGRDILTGEHRSARFNTLLDIILTARILDRGVAEPGLLRRLYRRFGFYLAFSREREAWAKNPAAENRDLLDVVFTLGGNAPVEQLIELYMSFAFAIIGSVGFTLGWSILLAVTHGTTDEQPRYIVSEALRLYPVAWMLGRRPRTALRLGDISVTPDDEVVVFPYAIHRNPACWPEPMAFRPARWHEHPDRSCWMPFGAGEHTCAAVSVTYQILDRLLSTLFNQYKVRVVPLSFEPMIGAALAPPPFTLELQRR